MNKKQEEFLKNNNFELNVDKWNNKSYIQKNYHNGVCIKVFERESYFFGFAISPFDYIYNKKELDRFNEVFYDAAEITKQLNNLGQEDFNNYVNFVKKNLIKKIKAIAEEDNDYDLIL